MKLGNNVRMTLGAAIDSDDTTIDLNVVPFYDPVPDPSGEIATAVLLDGTINPMRFEIITFTRMNNNVITGVSRAQEDTAAQAWPVGSFLVQDITAGMLPEISGSGLLRLVSGQLTQDQPGADDIAEKPTTFPYLEITEGPEPAILSGQAQIYLDQADGRLKVKSGSGITVLAP